ncbi:acetyltransferase [Acinetobacter baumannii]|nr:acetyltransferase [Acinetobacter baumannii]
MTLNTVTLSTQRLTLKPFTANDADETYNCITPTLTRYMAWDPQPRHEFDQTWSNWLKNFAFGTEIIFVIRENIFSSIYRPCWSTPYTNK